MEEILYCEQGRVFCRAEKVLLAVDGSEGSARAATVAFEIAEMTKSKLYVLHVVPTPTIRQFSLLSDVDPNEVLRRYNERGLMLLEGYREAALKYDLDIETVLDHGLPSDRIVSLSRTEEIDIIVIGSRGATGSRHTRMGSCTDRVVASADCTVVVAK